MPTRPLTISALAPDATERGNAFGAPPQQRQRHGDQPGAQHPEQREHAFDRVGDLDADDGVGVQPHAPQPSGDGRNHAIGLRIGEAARLAVGEALAVGRVDERNVVGPPLRRPAQQLIERRARAERAPPVGREDR